MLKKDAGLSVGFLYDDNLDSTDGVAQYVKTLGAWLSANGHNVTYLAGESKSTSWGGGQVYSLSRNLKMAWGGNRLSISLLPRLEQIKKVIKENQFDIAHVQVPYSPFMAQQVIKRLKSDTTVVGTFHIFPANFVTVFGSKLLRLVYGKSFGRFDSFISVSTAAQAYAKTAFGADSVVVPNTVDLKKFSSTQQPAANHIVFLGRLVKRKGAGELLKAFALLNRHNRQAYLTIAGEGPERKNLENFIKRHDLADRVKLAGYISEADKPKLLSSASVACFPSLYGESFGIVLIEAMAAGAGVVIGGHNAGYQSVLGAQPGLLFNPKDSAGLAELLNRLLSDKKLAGKLHSWQQAAVGQYDVAVVGGQLVDLYRQAIVKHQQKRHN